MKKWAVAGFLLPLCLSLSGSVFLRPLKGNRMGKPKPVPM